jgi:hypothetical protein
MTDFKDILAKAKKRAAENVETWIPEEEGDNDGGIIESITFIEFAFTNKHRADGLTPSTVIRREDGVAFRYNWMGTLPEQTFERTGPTIGDACWIHHHGTVDKDNKPKGYNPYENIQILIFDPITGEEKVPDTTIKLVDRETGEVITPVEEDKFALKPGEEAFGPASE